MSEKIETTQGIQQWEYTVSSTIPERLNKLGDEGWEAVGTIGNGDSTLLKRPKQPKKQQSNDYGYGR
ncbi:MAG: hypothetical protein IJZ27_03255 [Treponema sp.]|nr:hypothetical protein [Treponema sp.]